MFESAMLGRTVGKAEYDHEVARLRWELLNAQRALEGRPFPVIVLFGGVDGAGKTETIHLLNQWMDPRWLVNRAFDEPSQDERERPPFWRFWLALPPRGRLGLFLSAWYSQPLLDRVRRRATWAEFDGELDRIVAFERTLAGDGALILKFWMHLDKAAQKRRLESLERNPLTRWRVTATQWKHWRMYDRFVAATERLIQKTSRPHAPWTLVDGSDERYRSLVVGTALRDALQARLGESSSEGPTPAPAPQPAPVPMRRRARTVLERVERERSVLDKVDLSKKLPKAQYRTALERYQGRLNGLQRRALERQRGVILVFEGWDAAGKGGAIRRVTEALDPRVYRVFPIAAPSDEERARHYLWRFWRQVQRAGRVAIFDRSWYGRVLVERVEGFASDGEWGRAYAEINEFEEELTEHGLVLIKYWLHISRDEQARRFDERAGSPYERWKLSDEDWRNREKWDAYAVAVNDMVAQTSTRAAPWSLVAANDKHYARIEVLKIACRTIERALA
jgi:AMP-polyphosphate phosphotransferase